MLDKEHTLKYIDLRGKIVCGDSIVNNQPWLIGIVGGSGSGKTSVAKALFQKLIEQEVSPTLLDLDAYYNPKEVNKVKFAPDPINYDHPKALDVELMANHLSRLKQGQTIQKPLYDFTVSDRKGWDVPMNAKEVVILEGLLLFALPEIRNQLDVKVFVDTDPDIRLIRRLNRDMNERKRTLESVIKQYEFSVRPMHLEFVEPSKRWADIIVPVGVENVTALDMLFHHVLARIKK